MFCLVSLQCFFPQSVAMNRDDNCPMVSPLGGGSLHLKIIKQGQTFLFTGYVHLLLCSFAPVLSCVDYILGGAGGGGFLTLFGVPGAGEVDPGEAGGGRRLNFNLGRVVSIGSGWESCGPSWTSSSTLRRPVRSHSEGLPQSVGGGGKSSALLVPSSWWPFSYLP